MKQLLLLIFSIASFFSLSPRLYAQSNQTVANGGTTTLVNFNTSGFTYNWVNSNPSIGLPSSGTGNISSFTAINMGRSPVTATITATPASPGFAYITNESDGTISIISVATNKVVSTITPPHDAFCVCISPDGTKAYIGCSAGSSTVIIINTTTNAIISTIPVSASGESTGITVSPDNTMLYVANYVDGTVSAVNIATGLVVVIPVGENPYGVAITPDGSKVYVSFTYSNYVSVINTATNTVTGNITVGYAPAEAVVSPDGSKVYVPVSSSSHLAVIDPITNTIKAVIPTGPNPGVMALTPDGARAYVIVSGNGVSVINTLTNAIITTVIVGLASNGICVSPDGKAVYVTNTESDNVSVINTSTNTVIATINVGRSPVSLGNFISPGAGCPTAPITFTITVNPSPAIAASNTSGSIYSCSGMASISPNIQQFTVSGSNLTANIAAVAPAGFELSLTDAGGYSSSLMLTESGGTVGNGIIYVRSSPNAPAGNISGDVVLSSMGAANQAVAVSGIINAIPTVNTIASQTLTNGATTTPVNFTGTATTFSWVNDSPGIGLAANGTENISSFAVINNTNSAIIATITVTPLNGTKCNGTPITFTIIANPTPVPVIVKTPFLSIPNAFTPNSDGINDTWMIKNLEYYPASTINVFNRWGQKMFSSIGYPIPWDGKYQGKLLSSGTYYYIIDAKNGRAAITGWVAIIR
jgi:gliding motility-associated-like protein